MPEVNRFRVSAVIVIAAAMAVGFLALVGIRPAEAAFPGANGTIVFASNRTAGPGVANPTGDFELFGMKPDGTGIDQITSNATQDSEPTWSADGKKIAFTSDRGGDYEIYVMKAKPEGKRNRPKNLTKNDVSDQGPDWRPVH